MRYSRIGIYAYRITELDRGIPVFFLLEERLTGGEVFRLGLLWIFLASAESERYKQHKNYSGTAFHCVDHGRNL